MKKLLIFDFDGTLVDTITDVGICFNRALLQCDLPQHPLEKFSDFAGGNLETVVSKMLPPNAVTEKNIFSVKTLYRKLYLEDSKPNTKPYDGIMQLLNALKQSGYILAINSNKGQQLLDDMVEKIFGNNFFKSVVGYLESFPSKPDPYGVRKICAECHCSITEAIYIGDGMSDVVTAHNAGIPCVFVQWGQGHISDWENTYTAHIASNIKQLKKLLTTELQNDNETV